jgi:type II secretory pathway pseudopilin PulG
VLNIMKSLRRSFVVATALCFRAGCPAGYRSPRSGMLLVEIIAAIAILAVLLTSTVQVMRVMTTQHVAADRRTLALETVQNVAEQIGNIPWAELTPEAAGKLTVPDAVKPFLPEAKLAATVTDLQEPVAAKRVSIELTWNAPNGINSRPARLTVWSFQHDLASP